MHTHTRFIRSVGTAPSAERRAFRNQDGPTNRGGEGHLQRGGRMVQRCSLGLSPCRPHSSCSTSLESLPSPRCIWERASLLCSGFSGAEEETARGTSLRAERLCSLLAPTTPLFLSVTPSLLHRQSLDGTEATIQPDQWPPQPMRLPNGYELYNHLTVR